MTRKRCVSNFTNNCSSSTKCPFLSHNLNEKNNEIPSLLLTAFTLRAEKAGKEQQSCHAHKSCPQYPPHSALQAATGPAPETIRAVALPLLLSRALTQYSISIIEWTVLACLFYWLAPGHRSHSFPYPHHRFGNHGTIYHRGGSL